MDEDEDGNQFAPQIRTKTLEDPVYSYPQQVKYVPSCENNHQNFDLKIENSQKLAIMKIRKKNYQNLIEKSMRIRNTAMDSAQGFRKSNRQFFIKKKMANDIGAIYKVIDKSKAKDEPGLIQRTSEKLLKDTSVNSKIRNDTAENAKTNFTIEKIEERYNTEPSEAKDSPPKNPAAKELSKQEKIELYFRRIFGNEHMNRQQIKYIIQTLEERCNSNQPVTLERVLQSKIQLEPPRDNSSSSQKSPRQQLKSKLRINLASQGESSQAPAPAKTDKKEQIQEKYNPEMLQQRLDQEISDYKLNTGQINKKLLPSQPNNYNSFNEDQVVQALRQFLEFTGNHSSQPNASAHNFHHVALSFKDNQLFNKQFQDHCHNFYNKTNQLDTKNYSLENSHKVRDQISKSLGQIKAKKFHYNEKIYQETHQNEDSQKLGDSRLNADRLAAIRGFGSYHQPVSQDQQIEDMRDTVSQELGQKRRQRKLQIQRSQSLNLLNLKSKFQLKQNKIHLKPLPEQATAHIQANKTAHAKSTFQQTSSQIIKNLSEKISMYKTAYDSIFLKCSSEKKLVNRIYHRITTQQQKIQNTFKTLETEIDQIL